MRTAALLVLLVPTIAGTWNNGQSGNARTDLPEECDDPPYSTHDLIADKALEMLPEHERAWLEPHRNIYLIGTEAPDNSQILLDCGVPYSGYGDTGLGHSVDSNDDHTGWALRDTGELQDRAAVRAQEEYKIFSEFLIQSSLVRRTPYTAVKRISQITSAGDGDILAFSVMDATYELRNGNDEYLTSIGQSLNLAVNELTDVLHTFFLNVVEEQL